MAINKRTWVNIAAGTVAVLAIVFGVKQCSDKKEAREEAQEWHSLVNNNNETLADAKNALSVRESEVKNLTDSLSASKGIIAQKDSTILVLQDSLAVVNGKLEDCEKSKACPCKKPSTAKCGCNKKKTVAKKPVAKPVAQPCKKVEVPVCDQKPVVYVEQEETKSVVKVDDCAKKPDQSVIVNGDNNGTIIVNANGIVNGNTIVNGNNNNVNTAEDKVAAARRAYLQSCQGCAVVLKERVKCY